MKRLTLALAAPALALALTGCGGGLSEDEQTAADSLAASFGDQTAEEGEAFATCAGEAIVTEVGLDSLRADGLIDEENQAVDPDGQAPEISRETAEGMASAIVGCNDWDVQAQQLRDNEAFPASDEDIDAYVACMKEIDQDDYEQMLVRQLSSQAHGDEEAAQAAIEAITECQEPLAQTGTPESGSDEAPDEAPEDEEQSDE